MSSDNNTNLNNLVQEKHHSAEKTGISGIKRQNDKKNKNKYASERKTRI